MKETLQALLERFKSPVVIFGLVSTILMAAQISPENLTSWPILGQNILATLSNPFLVGSIVVAIAAYLNNPNDKDNF